ncbi:MAG: hypothetical protein AB7U82_14460 [Blastocatellales bacterium]
MSYAFQLKKPTVLSPSGDDPHAGIEPAIELQLCQLRGRIASLQEENDSLRAKLTQAEHQVVMQTVLLRNARQREMELRATLFSELRDRERIH